jgi:hypothetical protein
MRLAVCLLVACGSPSGTDLFTAPAGPLCAPSDGTPNESECCIAERGVASSVRTVVELSDPAAIAIGTCGKHLFEDTPHRRGFELPAEPDAYPIKIVLPAVASADPACDPVCNEFEPATMFGIAVDIDGAIYFAHRLSVLVPPPWKLVSGGCGEACPHPCLGGYQEYGHGRTCGTLDRGGFGFATGEPVAESLEVLVELVETTGPLGASTCCLYR